MTGHRHPIRRRALAAILAAAALVGPLSRPMLDAHQPEAAAHVESSHDSSRCVYTHDHRACLLLYSSAPVPSVEPALLPTAPRPWLASYRPSHDARDTASHPPNLPRAPPTRLT